MARKKHPIFRLHKIKIHRNRWLIWAVVYVVVVALATVGYIQVSNINFETQNLADSQFVPWHSYTNQDLNFSLRYPADWSIEASDKTTVNFVPSDSSDEGVSVSILKPAAETAIRKGLKNWSQDRITIDGNTAVKIRNSSDDGYSETIVMALRKSQLYVLRGTSSLVEKLLLTFNFLK
jgi:hypothetical protein